MCDVRSNLQSNDMPRLRAPLVWTMFDPPTLKLDVVNVDCRCLVVTPMHSVLSAFSVMSVRLHPSTQIINASQTFLSK